MLNRPDITCKENFNTANLSTSFFKFFGNVPIIGKVSSYHQIINNPNNQSTVRCRTVKMPTISTEGRQFKYMKCTIYFLFNKKCEQNNLKAII